MCAAGAVYTRYGKAEVGSPLLEHVQEELAECEGLLVRVRGDGQVYCVVLTTGVSTPSVCFASASVSSASSMAFHWSKHQVLLSCMTAWSKHVASDAYAAGTCKVPIMTGPDTVQVSVLRA